MWLVGAYVAVVHGVLYSRDRGVDSSVLVLGFGWAFACFAGVICMYFLGQQLWGRDAEPVDGMEERPSGSWQDRLAAGSSLRCGFHLFCCPGLRG